MANEQSLEVPPPINREFKFWRGFLDDAKECAKERELLLAFIVRELRQRYKGTRLGWCWALAKPLVLLAIYGLGVGVFLGANKSIPGFGIYLYSGLLAWMFFSTVVTGSISILMANVGLISKAAFRKELLIVSIVVVASVDLVIQTSVLILGYFLYGEWPSLTHLALIFWVFPLIAILAMSLGLVLSAANVYYRDVGFLTDLGLQVGFWLVPLVYSFGMVVSTTSKFPVLFEIYVLNPLVPVINAARYALWPGALDDTGARELMPIDETLIRLVVITLCSVVLLWLAQRFFSKVSGDLAQEL